MAPNVAGQARSRKFCLQEARTMHASRLPCAACPVPATVALCTPAYDLAAERSGRATAAEHADPSSRFRPID